MLLNGQRLLFSVAFFATLLLVGCVEIPSDGPTPPNYRSSIKFFNAASGRDTIAFPISKLTYTRKDSTTSTVNIGGTDSVRTKIIYAQTVSVSRYRRYDVNFAQSLEVYIDGALKSPIATGAASGYFDIASGSRTFTVKGNGTYIDSMRIVKIDTLETTYRDSIKGNTTTARLVFDSARAGTIVSFVPVGGTVKITVDSTKTTMETERQYSMYFVGRPAALEQNEGGLARFGNINFLSTQERLLFQPAGATDSASVKFVHAFTDTGSYSIRTSAAGSDIMTGLVSGGAIGRNFKAKVDTTYTFFVHFGAVNVDSISLPVSKTKTYSVVIQNNAGARKLQAYTH